MTDEHSLINDATIAAYLDGVSSPEDTARIELAVAKDLEFAEVLAGMRRILEVSAQYPEWDTEQLWKVFARSTGLGKVSPTKSAEPDYGDPVRLAHRSDAGYSGLRPGAGPRTFRTAREKEGVFSGHSLRRSLRFTGIGLIVGTVLLILGWQLGGAGVGRQTTATRYTTYTTAAGERAMITLPDDNSVALNVASKLEVPTSYGAGNHVVRLVAGEALFAVLHHDGTPFSVVSGMSTIRVLGTNFLVRHYATDTTVMVAVQEGKVVVGNTVVLPRRLVEVKRNGVLRERAADPAQFAFVSGVLVLPQMRLLQAIPELDRWYNGEIRLADPRLGDNVIAGRIPAGSLADLADVLSVITGGRVVRDGRILTLYRRTGR